jgi:hypothetical protein
MSTSAQDLAERIDANPDPLHADVTPAVLELIELGYPGARAVVGLLTADDVATRQRARRVLEGVVFRAHGWAPGRGFADPADDDRARAVIEENGPYRPDDPAEDRARSAQRWARWLDEQAA